MRVACPVIVLALLFLNMGCGSDAGTAGDRFSAKEVENVLGPEIEPRLGPPPKKLVYKDLKVGSGPVARRGDKVKVRYAAVLYETGKRFTSHWFSVPPLEVQLEVSKIVPGWEKSIEGMRVGGRREAIVPGRLNRGSEPLIYVTQLESIEPTKPRAPGG